MDKQKPLGSNLGKNPSFSARSWIATNCIGAHDLYPGTFDVVSNFTVMWNLFEGSMCNTNANIQAFEEIAEKISRHELRIEWLDEAVKFWISRYWTGSEFTELFSGLNFRPGNRRDHVEAVLRGEKTEPASQILAVMIILYRLRSNLFHGLKTVDMLNDQVANLNMACRALASVLEVSDSHLFNSRKT